MISFKALIAIRFHYGFDYIVANNWYVQTSGLIKHDKLNKLCDLTVISYTYVVASLSDFDKLSESMKESPLFTM